MINGWLAGGRNYLLAVTFVQFRDGVLLNPAYSTYGTSSRVSSANNFKNAVAILRKS
jgi:hypothetical protein